MVAPLLIATHISWHFWHIRTVSSWAEIRSSNSKQKACLSSQQTWNNMNSDKKSLEDGWFSSEKWWNILTKHGLPSLIGGISLSLAWCVIRLSLKPSVSARACLCASVCVKHLLLEWQIKRVSTVWKAQRFSWEKCFALTFISCDAFNGWEQNGKDVV